MSEERYMMSDLVEFDSTRARSFRLLGRVDKVQKVEGKRFSSTEMEKILAAHVWLTSAKVLVERTKRDEVCVVAQLSEQGARNILTGKRPFNLALKAYLADFFEAPLLPRKWRYVADYPCDAQGKVTRQALLTLFDTSAKTTRDYEK